MVEFSEEVLAGTSRSAPRARRSPIGSSRVLASQGHTPRMPHSRSLGDGLFELRFTCEGVNRRITYVFGPRTAPRSPLTTFRKQRQNERGRS